MDSLIYFGIEKFCPPVGKLKLAAELFIFLILFVIKLQHVFLNFLISHGVIKMSTREKKFERETKKITQDFSASTISMKI